MDLSPFKLDIDELVEEFAMGKSTSLADMKRIWLRRKFSFIYEARPSTNLSLFMQSLYFHSIGHMIADDSLSHRLGGLYCLYCLHETQPFKPLFKIYLSIEELKKLRKLVVDAKENSTYVAPALVERMLQRNMFLFGFVDLSEGGVQQRVNSLTDVQNALIQSAYKKLFPDAQIERFLKMDLDVELDIHGLRKVSTEYAKAKELAIKEAGELVDVQNIQHIAENQTLIGHVMGKISEDWKDQKQAFCKQTGFSQRHTEEHQQENDDVLGKELDALLSQA